MKGQSRAQVEIERRNTTIHAIVWSGGFGGMWSTMRGFDLSLFRDLGSRPGIASKPRANKVL
jgi:hypothetical protein